ncbi:MAG: aminotransferase class I/II-fold pyridoxal phosphate-dependent enzyme, partial [Gammaproteobacteria bacterium]
LLLGLSSDGERAGITTGPLGRLARTLWSMPPDHGAALVERVLSQPALRQDWMTELSHMANRINSLRGLLAERLSAVSGVDYGWVAAQRGMFSRLPLSSGQVAFARDPHHLYMPPDGRINIAGVSPSNVDRVAAGLIAAVRS